MADDEQQAGQGFDWFRHGDGNTPGQDEPHQSGGGGDGQAGADLPATVFVSGLGDGALFLQSWPTGMNIYLGAAEAQPLTQELISVLRREARLRRLRDGQ